jgi:protein gp37
LKRLEILKTIPAVIRFVSIEPLLEDLGNPDLAGIHWAIVGGESGPGARPMKPAWVDSIYRQCREQGIPFFFKQWGKGRNKGGCTLHGREFKEFPGEVKV